MDSHRLDQYLANRGITSTRSQAESYIKLGLVTVDGEVTRKPSKKVSDKNAVRLTSRDKYVSRGGLKLASVAKILGLNFKDKTVLDVGSSTGGFTDFALQRGAKQVIAVDSGANQLHPSLRDSLRIKLYEQTDIRQFDKPSTKINIVLIDVSFISLRHVLPSVKQLVDAETQIVAMVKPQFETRDKTLVQRGVIKNNAIRRRILKDFETWVKAEFKILSKADSGVAGEKGNVERFYLLKIFNS